MSERWFAWHPVRLIDGKPAWLRWVNRVRRGTRPQGRFGTYWWEYFEGDKA